MTESKKMENAVPYKQKPKTSRSGYTQIKQTLSQKQLKKPKKTRSLYNDKMSKPERGNNNYIYPTLSHLDL